MTRSAIEARSTSPYRRMIGTGLMAAGAIVAAACWFGAPSPESPAERTHMEPTVLAAEVPSEPVSTESAQLDPKRAYDYLVKICRLGPRPSGSRGMAEQQKLLLEHFSEFGAEVRFQTFDVAHPVTGAPVRMSNMVVSWHPEAKDRVLLCCHYDTRPYPDRDPRNPRGTFLGANDGASGVALLMELGHHLQELKPAYGVDFVFFDGEELIYGDLGTYFLGSEHFARDYRDNPPPYRYHAGVLVDMIGDRTLTLYQESYSLNYAEDLAQELWGIARRLGIREFIPREKWEVRDDHIPLNEIARIPTCDIIDFDYPYWHTTQDLPSKCSGASLVKVGRVLLAWLEKSPERGS